VTGPRLKDLGRWFSGGTPPSERAEYWDGDVPWLSGKDFNKTVLREPTKFTTATGAALHSRLVPGGQTVLVLVRGMALAHGLPVARLPFDAAINQDVRGLVLRPEFDPEFVYYALVGRRAELNAHIDRAAHGTARLLETVYAHRIAWMPELEAQRVIADFLDRECQRIDSARVSALNLAGKAGTELNKRVHHLLDRDAEASVTPRLRWVATVLSGFAFSSDRFVRGSEMTVRLLRGVNVGVGTTRWDDVVGWDADDVEPYSRWRLRKGDVVVGMDRPWISAGTRVATLGDSDLPALLLQRVACIRPRGVVSADYLRLWLEHPRFSAELAGAATGISVPHISGDQIGAFRVPAPDVARQGEVVAHSTSAARNRELLDVVATRLASLLESYRDSLIHEAVTGKLDVTAASDRQMDERLHAAAEGRLDEVPV
jgi:type I restriction enzyme S subunit